MEKSFFFIGLILAASSLRSPAPALSCRPLVRPHSRSSLSLRSPAFLKIPLAGAGGRLWHELGGSGEGRERPVPGRSAVGGCACSVARIPAMGNRGDRFAHADTSGSDSVVTCDESPVGAVHKSSPEFGTIALRTRDRFV